MMKQFCILLFIFSQVFGKSDSSIVFVHIGKELPDYAKIAYRQAKYFNPNTPVIFLINQEAIDLLDQDEFECVSCESLKLSDEHRKFNKKSSLNKVWRKGFWRYTSERFLYLAEYIEQYDLKNVFHMEYDNLLYMNLNELLPVFKEKYTGIAATFDNDQRCVPGFIYISNAEVIKKLAHCFAHHAKKGLDDMKILNKFRSENQRKNIEFLPIIHKGYIESNSMISPMGHRVKDKSLFCNNIELFDAIFDAAAMGQYLGGIDPQNGVSRPGFINESCIFNPDSLKYQWEKDAHDRLVLFTVYNNEKRRVVNLHIHSKNLEKFCSYLEI